ncbi:MAG: uroporphyrinogen decarboxylase family protein [Terriglobia bacterium]
MMNSRERLLAAIRHQKPDHVPLYFQCFGFTAPPQLRWQRGGVEVQHWYSMRHEHLHTWPEPWSVENDFERVRRWASLGGDDVLDVSPPWGMHPDVRIRDWQEPPEAGDRYGRILREYETPAGPLRHVVYRTDEEMAPGWVIQPDHVALFEDMNIARGVRHAVVGPEDLPKLRYLLHGPSPRQLAEYRERVAKVRQFAGEQGVPVFGWSAFGMDAMTWLCGVERTVMAAMTEPEFFQELVDVVYDFDRRRTEMMLEIGGMDVVLQRGWYSSPDFWSPALFQRFLTPGIKRLAAITHQAGAIFAYAMTTGAMAMADQLLDAKVDLLLYVDPTQEKADLAAVKDKFKDRLALAGGISSAITLYGGTRQEIRQAVHMAIQELGPSGFILAPVSSLTPDIPWPNVEAMIETWREVRDIN